MNSQLCTASTESKTFPSVTSGRETECAHVQSSQVWRVLLLAQV